MKASDLLEEETPPEPPAFAPAGGPQPSEFPYDFAWERQVVPANPADRYMQRVDETNLAPLPLDPKTAEHWRITARRFTDDPSLSRYEYLLRKGHVGAVAHAYPEADSQRLFELLLEHGFTTEQATREAKRREKVEKMAASTAGVVERLLADEQEHFATKDAFSRAFLERQQREKKKR